MRSVPAQRSLSVASLDIGRVLADRDGVTFRAQGTCMYPAVRPGDVLRIRTCTASETAVGDIAVCRRHGLLFGHRVVGKGVRDERAFVVTRPDRARRGDDGPTFDEDLLGVVASITRRGVGVPASGEQDDGRSRLALRLRLALIESAPRVRSRLATALTRAQTHGVYRCVARRAFVLTRPRLEYVVHVPLNATLGDAVYRRVDPADFDPDAPWQGRVRDRWSLVLHVNGARKAAATATFERSGGVWRRAASHVRQRYCGLGLERLLLARAELILTRAGTGSRTASSRSRTPRFGKR